MKKFLLSLIALVMLCATNAWGVSWTCGNTTISISGSSYVVSPIADTDGAMSDLASAPTSNWGAASYKNSSTYTSIVFEEGVTHIGAHTFNGFSYVTSVTIPASVASIGDKAFNGCSKIAEIHASTPNNWASIDMDMTSGRYSHPFAASGGGDFYFYGDDSYTTELYFTPGITCIKKGAFYNAKTISRVCLPASVSEIQDYALDCHMTYFATLRTAAMTLGTNRPLSFKKDVDSYLYLPQGANSDYKSNSKFYDGDKTNEFGASKIGYSSSDAGATTWETGKYVYPLSGTTGDLSWQIIQNTGTLRIYGNGSAYSSYTDGSSSLPWYRFKLLIDKVIIEGVGGKVAHVYNNIKFFPALREIQIIQDTLPNINSTGISSSLKHNENVTIKIPVAVLSDASVKKLGSAPWSSDKLDIALSEKVIYAGTNATTSLDTLSAIKNYIELPFDIELKRSMSKTDEYYTFCSPIDLDADQVATIFGASAKLHTMTSSSYDEGTNELELNFDDCSTIVAGKPYIVMPSQAVSNPTIENVNPGDITTTEDNIEATNVTFYGTLAPRAVTDSEIDGGKMIILIGNSELTWANGGAVGGMRAYWLLDKTAPAGVKKAKPVMRIGKIATAIEEVRSENTNAVRSEKVLRNGQIYILRDNKMYNMQGQIVK